MNARFACVVLCVGLVVQAMPIGAQCVEPPPDLIHWWTFDETEGSTADDVADGSPGTLMNGPAFMPGMVANGLSFDGVDDLVSFGNAAGNFGTSDFTIDFWIKTSSVRREGVLGKRPVCGNSSFWDIRIGQSNTPPFAGPGKFIVEMDQNGAANRNVLFGTTAINDGNFHHVAVVRQGTTAFLYIDGALDTSNTISGITDIANSVELIAGKSKCTGIDGTQFFAGTLDELELFHRALSGNEIQAIYDAGSEGKCKPSLPPTIEELLERIESLEDHTHTYLTGNGNGHNNTEAETGPVEVPEE